MEKPSQRQTESTKLICENRRAHFDYEIIETFEAGLVLTGPEIKSIRLGEVSINESYIRPDGSELKLIQMHIKPYAFDADSKKYEPLRPRKLLLHRRQINSLISDVQKKRLTIVPLKLYMKGGFCKALIALAKGKANPDKRRSIKERDANREMAKVLKRARE